jgi:hypothetical protein
MMMFDPNSLKLGDVLFRVVEKNGYLARKKIHRAIDGVDWFRYDRQIREYKIVTYKVIGFLQKTLHGEWLGDCGDDLKTEWYLSGSNGEKETWSYSDMINENIRQTFFHNVMLAENYMQHKNDMAREYDLLP